MPLYLGNHSGCVRDPLGLMELKFILDNPGQIPRVGCESDSLGEKLSYREEVSVGDEHTINT